MSKCNIINIAAFYKLKAGQTVFHIQMDQFGQKKVVAEILETKPRAIDTVRLSQYSYEERLRMCNWPILYPKHLIFRTRRAATRHMPNVTGGSEDARHVVKRVRLKSIETGDTIRLLLSTKYMDNSDPELAKSDTAHASISLD